MRWLLAIDREPRSGDERSAKALEDAPRPAVLVDVSSLAPFREGKLW
jgi:hypothetical protein